jgi:hypothetical protein
MGLKWWKKTVIYCKKKEPKINIDSQNSNKYKNEGNKWDNF